MTNVANKRHFWPIEIQYYLSFLIAYHTRASVVAQMVKNPPTMQATQVRALD